MYPNSIHLDPKYLNRDYLYTIWVHGSLGTHPQRPRDPSRTQTGATPSIEQRSSALIKLKKPRSEVFIIGAFIIGIGFGDIVYHNYNKEPPHPKIVQVIIKAATLGPRASECEGFRR